MTFTKESLHSVGGRGKGEGYGGGAFGTGESVSKFSEPVPNHFVDTITKIKYMFVLITHELTLS